MAAGGGQETAAGKDPWSIRSRTFKSFTPGHIHPVVCSATANSGYTGFCQPLLEVLAKVCSNLRHGGACWNRVLRVDVYVPESW